MLCALVCWLPTIVSAADGSKEIVAVAAVSKDIANELYQPSHKTAAILISAVAPIYGDEAKLSTEGKYIIMRAEQKILNQIQELLLQLDHPPQQFIIEVNNRPAPPNTKTYSTNSRSLSQKSFTLTENIPLILVKEQQQQLNTLRPLWIGRDTIPSQREFLHIKIQSAKDQIYVDFRLQTLVNGRFSEVSNRISGSLYEWLPVSSSRTMATSTTNSTTSSAITKERNWSAQTSRRENLYIKVSPAS